MKKRLPLPMPLPVPPPSPKITGPIVVLMFDCGHTMPVVNVDQGPEGAFRKAGLTNAQAIEQGWAAFPGLCIECTLEAGLHRLERR